MADAEEVKVEADRIIGQYQNHLPRLVVFDLDYTLWPLYCDSCDEDDVPYLFPHARGIIDALKGRGIDMAIASRSPTRNVAKTFLDKLSLTSLFAAEEIFSSWTHKTEHFQKIQETTRIPFESMLFFDDEHRNIGPVSRLGVTCILVHNGVTLDAFGQGLGQFSAKAVSLTQQKEKETRT